MNFPLGDAECSESATCPILLVDILLGVSQTGRVILWSGLFLPFGDERADERAEGFSNKVACLR